jgi:hypothetical protein
VDSAHGALRSKPDERAFDAMAYAPGKRREAPPREAPSTSSEVVRSAYDSFDLSNARRSKSGAGATVADIRPLNPGPVSVFISRKEGKLFVRKGFDPIFSTPVKFSEPERPLGTHLFTALEVNDDDTMRWNVVTVPTAPGRTVTRSRSADPNELVSVGRPSSAAEALDRITVPADATSRISDLLSVGASLIISDQGLDSETGAGTDFTVLMP